MGEREILETYSNSASKKYVRNRLFAREPISLLTSVIIIIIIIIIIIRHTYYGSAFVKLQNVFTGEIAIR